MTPATEKQISYLAQLLLKGKANRQGELSAKDTAEAELLENVEAALSQAPIEISKAHASVLIDTLKFVDLQKLTESGEVVQEVRAKYAPLFNVLVKLHLIKAKGEISWYLYVNKMLANLRLVDRAKLFEIAAKEGIS